MLQELTRLIPLDAIKIALVLVLSFFIGIEREEHKQRDAPYAFGGIRTFPLIGLFSYALATVSSASLLPWTAGLALIGGLMIVSYRHKISENQAAGLTTELSALATYLIGALVHQEHYWIAATIGVVSVLLLELKQVLEGLAERIEPNEILTTAKFLLLTVVILPIVPNRDFTPFHLNPLKTWLVVVAVSGVSFASYFLQKMLRGRGGVFLCGVLGGAYSSTATTVVLSRQSKEIRSADLFSGTILAACGVMYARLAILVAFFNLALAAKLAPAFAVLAGAAVLAGWLVSRRSRDDKRAEAYEPPKNPLQLTVAFLLAATFLAIRVLIALARNYLGSAGLYGLAIVMGVADVDPFILGLAQSTPTSSLATAASAILIAAASNNIAKGIYASALADKATGRKTLILLAGLGALGFVPLTWI